MSHTATIKTQFKDEAIVRATCKALGLSEPVTGTHRLYQGTMHGLGVQLPGWNYPVIINTATGAASFDNFNGRWGKQSELDRFTQHYAIEKVSAEARKKGYIVTKRPAANGAMQLVLTNVG